MCSLIFPLIAMLFPFAIQIQGRKEHELIILKPNQDQFIFYAPFNLNSNDSRPPTNLAVLQIQKENNSETGMSFKTEIFENVIVVLHSYSDIGLVMNQGFKDVSTVRNLKMLIMIPFISWSGNGTQEDQIKREVLSSASLSQLKYLNLESQVYVSFYKIKSSQTNIQIVVQVYEVYFIKSVLFVKLILSRRTFPDFYSVLDSMFSDNLEQVNWFLRRQDWTGVNLECAFFLTEVPKSVEKELMNGVLDVDRFEVNVRWSKESGLVLMHSLSAYILWDFKRALNFTYSLTPPFGYDKGLFAAYKDENRSFDLILSHFGMASKKLEYAQHLLPTYFNGIVAFFVQPPVYLFRNIFSRPLSSKMWIMISAAWLLLIISFKIITWLRGILLMELTIVDKEERYIDETVQKDIVLWAIAAACQQGWYITPASLPARLVFVTGLLFSFLCYSSYTAKIVSQLWGTSHPLKDIDMLLNNVDEILIGEDSDINNLIVDRMSKNPELLSKIRHVSSEFAVERILKSNMGYSCYMGWSDYFVGSYETTMNISKPSKYPGNLDQEYCALIWKFGFKYLPLQIAMFVHKRSPLTKTLNYRIVIGRERGYIRRYWREYDLHTNIFCLKESNMIYALGLQDTWAAFGLLTLGYSLSLTILLIEIFKGNKKTP